MYGVCFNINRGNRKGKQLNYVIVTATILNKTTNIEKKNGNIIYVHAVTNVGDWRIHKRTHIWARGSVGHRFELVLYSLFVISTDPSCSA